MLTVLGIVLLLIPFSLVLCFKDRVRGFAWVFTIVGGLHIFLALVTQALGVFTYPVIVTLHSLVALISLLIFYRKKPSHFWRIKINWFLIAAIFIVAFELWALHFNYSGPVTSTAIVRKTEVVERSSYTYPTYSDEWVGVALTDYSIREHTLPNVNPLYKNQPLSNPLLAFFSVVAEIMMLLHLTPLIHYSLMAIASGIIICFLIYLTCRAFKLSPFVSGLVFLCVPYLTNANLLPGIWYLLPFIGGTMFLLVMIISYKKTDMALSSVAGGIAILLYPPIAVFVLPIFIFLIKNK